MDYYENMFKNVDSNIKLDIDQIKAIEEENNTIILAGAGSGKTTTLTAKIKYLVEIKKINPKEILMLSFTNEATQELIQRINIQFKIPVEILTFHKLGLKIIKQIDDFKIISNNTSIIDKIIKNKYFIFKKEYNISLLISNQIINYKEQNNNDKSIIKIYNKYQKYLKDNNLIDFSDMIIKATNYIERDLVKLKYKYVIVDEYQDISLIRYKLIKAIVDKTKAKIIVVGDDYQSIFSFAGSKIDLFLQFKNEFKAKMYLLAKTYRNSQQLINIASRFISKNKNQINKKLKSDKSIENPVIIKWYKKNKEKSIKEILENLSGETLILGRYTFDKKPIEKYLNNYTTYMTIHSSKGLGFDNVILINVEKGKYGFPSSRSSLEEERRLMYVALTRTKNRVYIVAKKRGSSKFLKEIQKII